MWRMTTSPADGQLSQAARERVAVETQFCGGRGQPHRRVAGDELSEDGPQLDASQGCADAVAHAMAEGEVSDRRAVDIEPVWAGEDALVVVGGTAVEQDKFAGADQDPADLQIIPGVAGDPAAALARCPQRLLHRGWYLAGIMVEGLPLTGVGQQEQRAHSDGNYRGLVAGEQ